MRVSSVTIRDDVTMTLGKFPRHWRLGVVYGTFQPLLDTPDVVHVNIHTVSLKTETKTTNECTMDQNVIYAEKCCQLVIDSSVRQFPMIRNLQTLLHTRRQTLRVHSPDGSTFLREMTLWPPPRKYDVTDIRRRQ